MQPRDKNIPIAITEVIDVFKKKGHTLTKPLLMDWEKVFPMFKPIKHSNGARFYTDEDLEILDMIVDLVKVKGCNHSYALTAIKNSRSIFLQKRRAIVHLEDIKKQLEDWKRSL